MPSAATSGPVPSPPITAILSFFVFALKLSLRRCTRSTLSMKTADCMSRATGSQVAERRQRRLQRIANVHVQFLHGCRDPGRLAATLNREPGPTLLGPQRDFQGTLLARSFRVPVEAPR